jgi:hypothetical protein
MRGKRAALLALAVAGALASLAATVGRGAAATQAGTCRLANGI